MATEIRSLLIFHEIGETGTNSIQSGERERERDLRWRYNYNYNGGRTEHHGKVAESGL